MDRNIVIVGGDKRNQYLYKLLKKENYKVAYIEENTQLNTIQHAETIIGPIPFSKDYKNLYSDNSKNKISIIDLLKNCKGKKIIAGSISKDIQKMARENKVQIIDIMQNESLAVLNTIATAEGAIEVAMKNTETTIQGSKVLILGFGRVAKVTAQKFSALLAKVTCAARKPEALAWIETNGYKAININNMEEKLNQFDIIINTPPTIILDKKRLQKLKKDCLVIDLASKPGGVDQDAVKSLGINYKWALALPGKVAPITSAKYIKRVIEKEEQL